MKKFRAAVGMLGMLSGLVVSTPAFAAGPDVIVGDLPDVVNNLGVANGRRMWGVGTTSCNLGDQPLTWIDCTNASNPDCRKHPVISQNMYRLMNGRFEQVGQAWLKHGFCALQGTVCSSCTPGGNCDALFPGCSDPYSASLNASPGGLGPKSEVNPVTGTFPYPWLSNGSGGANSNQKLLQVATTELDAGLAANALWFVSSIYIQPEDSQMGNALNNQSYRRVNVAAGSYNISLQDTTQRTKPAIYAWRDHGLGVNAPDPNVFITTVDVPGDGRFIIAAKATNVGGTTWRYEYAIQNFNSDRAAQAFRVPYPSGTTVVAGSVGFHDVDYLNGEPYSGTNWNGSTASGTGITWSTTETFAQNPNANALRWDTIYNYRFDCNQPPSGGEATLTLFKPGTPSSMSVSTIVPSPDGTFHPLNDTCAAATNVGAGTTTFSNANANTDGLAEPGQCVVNNYTQIGADVWFRYTSGSCTTGPTTISTCGSNFDTKVFVYPGTSCPSAPGTVIACSDDSNTCGANSLQSSLTFQHAANTSYLIRIGGYNGATGNGTLTITPPSCGPVAPANDTCAGALFLADGIAATGSTTAATNDGTASCGSSSTSADVWFAYRPVTSGAVNVNTCGSGFDTVMSVFTGSCGSLTQVACNDDNATGGNNACGGGLSSGINVNMTGGTTYYIRVAGYQGAVGNFNVRAIGGGGTIPAPNDSCAARPGVGLGDTAFNNTNCTTDGPTHTGCNYNGSNQITRDLWFNYPSTFNGRIRVDTCSASTAFNTKIAVYNGGGCADFESRLLGCNDDGACGSGRSSVEVDVVAGQNYTIRVGSFNNAQGAGVLTITDITGPTCGDQDFNGDGDFGTDADIEAFFACLGGNCCASCFAGGADFNGDGDIGTDADIESFFRVLGGGAC
ncbi:MAG TPA: hypothetical protein VD997_04860 [Phycisphaerales bacterium]|nr:hypothetical protein [Phycisphaerales bacterium]